MDINFLSCHKTCVLIKCIENFDFLQQILNFTFPEFIQNISKQQSVCLIFLEILFACRIFFFQFIKNIGKKSGQASPIVIYLTTICTFILVR